MTSDSTSSSGKIIPFSADSAGAKSDFFVARSKIVLKTSLHQPIPAAYGIATLDAVRLSECQANLRFTVELRWDQPGQTLLCGLITPDHTRGVAVVLDPASGAIIDALNGAGPLGFLLGAPLLPGKPVRVEIRLLRFGKNCICSVAAGAGVVSYPAFLSTGEEVFHAVAGSDVGSGSSVHFRNAVLSVAQSDGAKVA